MIYVDTSVWVALLTPEERTLEVEQWFAQAADPLASADWALTEFHSAIAIKVRTNQLTADQAKNTLTLFDQLGAGGMVWTAVSRAAFRAAADLVDDYPCGLRGADALHLAVAQDLGITRFATLDTQQADNAARLGFSLESF
jgi:predicted nucleic acid-binding protein